MQINQTNNAISMAIFETADLQDNLLTATNDLERLQTLLEHSHQALQEGFFGLLQLLQDACGSDVAAPTGEGRATGHVASAVKALQFQDMASQLIEHTSRRLRNCADRLARDAFADDEDEEAAVEAAPQRPNPVTQSEMDTGFVELF